MDGKESDQRKVYFEVRGNKLGTQNCVLCLSTIIFALFLKLVKYKFQV